MCRTRFHTGGGFTRECRTSQPVCGSPGGQRCFCLRGTWCCHGAAGCALGSRGTVRFPLSFFRPATVARAVSAPFVLIAFFPCLSRSSSCSAKPIAVAIPLLQSYSHLPRGPIVSFRSYPQVHPFGCIYIPKFRWCRIVLSGPVCPWFPTPQRCGQCSV